MSITIKPNPNGDTRTAPKDVTYAQFQTANDMHRDNVCDAMTVLADKIKLAGKKHDYSKKTAELQFYSDFRDAMNDDKSFVDGLWYRYHINAERHHLMSRCPDDVNLIDVLEMIVDCVCAGIARSGEVRELEISTDILEKAVKNTVTMLVKEIEVVE